MDFLKDIATAVQVISVVVASAIAVMSFNRTRKKEAESPVIEAGRPFIELRTEKYMDTLKAVGVLAAQHDVALDARSGGRHQRIAARRAKSHSHSAASSYARVHAAWPTPAYSV